MKNLVKATVFFTLVFSLSNGYFSFAEEGRPKSQENATFQKVNFFIDFSDYEGGSVEQWLQSKGFVFEGGAKDRKKIDLDVGENGLVLETKTRTREFLFNENVELEEFSSVRIEWGIIKYPVDASYEKKVNNEALMLYIFFGYDKISSGHFALPNSPYFIALFLGKDDEVNKPYLGRFYHKGGRFVCVGNPKSSETVITEFDLIHHFKAFYEKDEVPIISGISLGVDTSASGDGGRAAAFIKSIEFLE